MSKFCIMRFQKYKVGSVANIERHQKHRDRLKHRKHPERECENKTWVQSPEKNNDTSCSPYYQGATGADRQKGS